MVCGDIPVGLFPAVHEKKAKTRVTHVIGPIACSLLNDAERA